jgi:acetate kinase
MDECVLVLNAGSSSLKFAVYRWTGGAEPEVAARGQIEGIGGSPRMSAGDGRGHVLETAAVGTEVQDAETALDYLADWLRETFAGIEVTGVGHRVVHGGPGHAAPALVTDKLLTELRMLLPLAPLHQPHNLAAIDAVAARLPEARQVACFDTSFHRTMPEVAQLVPLPADLRDTAMRRYGFHGISCEYIASVLPGVAPEIADKRVIIAHLGSGASMCALRAGRSVESTMSFTALDGLCMGTRPGSIDPGVVLYLFQTFQLSPREVEGILYRKSGLLGISGISNDTRRLESSAEPTARLAIDYFVYRATREIGALASVLGGLDGLVFTAGIGENSPELRRRICAASAWLGVNLDEDANRSNRSRLSTALSSVSVWRIPTNEELMIARHTGRLLGLG